MGKILKLLAALIGVYLAVMLAAGFAIKYFVAGPRLPALVTSIGARLPVPVDVADGDFDIVNWLRFRPSIELGQVRVGNPKGFSTEPMLEAELVSAQMSLTSMLGEEIRVLGFTLHEPVFTIETNAQGRTNVEAIFEHVAAAEERPAPTEAPPADSRSLAVDLLEIKSGTLRYSGPGAPPFTVRDINITLSNFGEDKTCNVEVDARLFGGDHSQLAFDGKAGPYTKTSLPANGALQVELAPAEIPTEIRDEYLGSLLGDPGDGSLVRLESTLAGDLLGAFEGSGKLSLSELMIGRDRDHRLAFEGDAPLEIRCQKLLGNPTVDLRARDATITLGEGQWRGQLGLGYTAPNFRMESAGAISGVRINELLGAFTNVDNAVFGAAELPRYTLRSTGRNADQLRARLAGNGRVELEEGRLALFDLMNTIERHASKLLGGESSARGQTKFLRLATSFRIEDQRVMLPDATLEGYTMAVSGQGYFTFDKELHLDLDAAIRGKLASVLGGRPDQSGVPTAGLPVTIRGTMNDPKVRPAVGKVVEQKARGFFESLLRKAKEAAEKEEAATAEPAPEPAPEPPPK